MSGICLFLQRSTTQAFVSHTVPIVYTALVANPSTGKSKALRLVADAIEQVEQYIGVTPNDSQQVCAATIESMLNLLDRLKRVIG